MTAKYHMSNDKDILISVHHTDGDRSKGVMNKSIRDIIADCYSSNQNIGGADKWKDLIDATLDNIRMKMPSVSEIQNVLCATMLKKAIQAFDSKTKIKPATGEEMAEAIHRLMLSKIQ